MDRDKLIRELEFSTSTSSGPGGQHVNRTASRVTLKFDLASSQALNERQKQRLEQKLGSKINTQGNIVMHCSDTRSQHRNKALLIDRFIELLREGLKQKKKRKKTKPGRSATEKRLKAKKHQALKKSLRKKPPSS